VRASGAQKSQTQSNLKIYHSTFMEFRDKFIQVSSPSTLLQNWWSRRGRSTGGNGCASASQPFQVVRSDHPDWWRWNMGGADPATPIAEGMINFHNHAVTWMVFVVCTVFWPMKCRI